MKSTSETAEVLKGLADNLETAIGDLYDAIEEQMNTIKSAETEPRDLVDMGYFCRKIRERADELRKDADARLELIGKVICIRLIDPNAGDLVARARGKYAVGTPDLKMVATVPKKGSPEYLALLKHFGVDESAIKAGLFNANWKRLKDMTTELTEQGVPLPPGIGEPYPEYRTIFRSNKENE